MMEASDHVDGGSQIARNAAYTPYKKPGIFKDGKNMLIFGAALMGVSSVVLCLIGKNIIKIPYTHELSRSIIFGAGLASALGGVAMLGVRFLVLAPRHSYKAPVDWKGVANPSEQTLKFPNTDLQCDFKEGIISIYVQKGARHNICCVPYEMRTEALPSGLEKSVIVVNNLGFDTLYDVADYLFSR